MIRISRKTGIAQRVAKCCERNPFPFLKLTCEKPAEIIVGADGSLPLKEERLSGRYI